MCIVLYTFFYVVLHTGFYVAGNSFSARKHASANSLQVRAGVGGHSYCKSTVWARRKVRRRSIPKTMSLSFLLAPETARVDGFRASRMPPLAKMLEVSIMTGLPPMFKLTNTIRR